MKSTFTLRALLICGILASLIYVGSDIFAAVNWEGYSYSSQTVSELRAVGAPTRAFLIPTLFVYAILEIAFGSGIRKVAGQKRTLALTGGLLVGLGVLDLMGPLFSLNIGEAVGSLTNTIHVIVTVLTMVFIFLILGFGAFTDRKWFRFYSIFTILIFTVTGVWALLEVPRIAANIPTLWLGIRERIGIYGYMLWMGVLAITLLRKQTKPKEQYNDHSL
jgi:hypothetical protein